MSGEKLGKMPPILTKAVASVNIKASVFFETAKIKTHIATVEAEIKDLMHAIGEKAYQLWERDVLDSSSLVEQLLLIREKHQTIVKLQDEIVRLESQETEVFGSKKLDENENSTPPPKAQPASTCSKCHAEFAAPVKFCKKCGNKMDSKAE